MFWKKQNHIDREILSEMMFTDYKCLALEIFTTAHWEPLPDSEKDTESAVYGCYYKENLILAKKNEEELWEVKVCHWNSI